MHKIGFISAVTPEAFTKTSIHALVEDTGVPLYSFLNDDTGEKLAASIQCYVNEVREKGTDIVILITHLGESDDEDNGYATNKLVSRVRGIDAVIDGHSHATYSNRLVDPDGREIVTAQTGEKLAEIGRMDIAADGTITSQLIDRVPEPEGLPFLTVARRNGEVCVDADMNRLIQEKILEYTPVIDRKIGEVAFDLLYCSEVGIDFGRSEETGLANLLSDAYRSVGGGGSFPGDRRNGTE